MYNVYLFQPQYAVEFRQEINYWLPYSAGCLWSYLSTKPHIKDSYQLDKIFFKRDPIEVVLAQMQDPCVVGFSCYLWNEQYCLSAAEAIKKQWPNCLIVFGGVQTSVKMLDYDFIDSVVLGEGEESFAQILESKLNQTPIESIYTASRINNLDFDSPYLSGVFDNIIEQHPDAIWAMTMETNRGCPYACTFCNWGATTASKIKRFGLERVAQELTWAKEHKVAYIFCADANFGILRERDFEIAKLMREAADNSSIEAINLQYAKNSTQAVFDIAKIIGPYGRGITVSVQSMNQNTLEAIRRENLKIYNIKELLQLSHEYQIGTYTEVILGLPLETTESWREGLTQLLELGQHQSIDMWMAQLLEGSEMATSESRRRYGIKSVWVEDYLNLDQTNDHIKEYTEIVNQTNTMSTDEMVDNYMYAWMIIQIHIAGYSQILARYARNIKRIPYRVFYDQLYELIKQEDTFSKHFTDLKQLVYNYLHTGILPKGITGGHALHSKSYSFVYANRLQIIKICSKIIDILPELSLIQQKFMFDINHTEHVDIQANYNIFTGTIEPTKYHIQPRTTKLTDDFYTIRRKGLLKNLITT